MTIKCCTFWNCLNCRPHVVTWCSLYRKHCEYRYNKMACLCPQYVTKLNILNTHMAKQHKKKSYFCNQIIKQSLINKSHNWCTQVWDYIFTVVSESFAIWYYSVADGLQCFIGSTKWITIDLIQNWWIMWSNICQPKQVLWVVAQKPQSSCPTYMQLSSSSLVYYFRYISPHLFLDSLHWYSPVIIHCTVQAAQ